jgi:hypothetical protein
MIETRELVEIAIISIGDMLGRFTSRAYGLLVVDILIRDISTCDPNPLFKCIHVNTDPDRKNVNIDDAVTLMEPEVIESGLSILMKRISALTGKQTIEVKQELWTYLTKNCFAQPINPWVSKRIMADLRVILNLEGVMEMDADLI